MLNRLLKYILFLIPIVLLFVFDNMFFPFISGKSVLFRFVVEISALLYVIDAFKNKSIRPRSSPLLILVGLFLLSIFISNLLSLNFTRAFWSNFERSEGFVLLMHLGLYMTLLGSVLKEKKDWLFFWYGTITVGITMALYAVLQITGGTVINQSAVRVDSLMGNSAYFAGFLMFLIFILALLYKQDDTKSRYLQKALILGSVFFSVIYAVSEAPTLEGRLIAGIALVCSLGIYWFTSTLSLRNTQLLHRALYLVVCGGFVYMLFMTQTRGALLGFIGGLFVTVSLLALFEKNNKIRKTSFVILGSIVFVVLGFIAIRNTSFVRESPILNRFAEISWSNTNGQARQIIWPMALEGFKEKPVFGWGQEGFNYVFLKYYDTDLWRHEPWFDRTHNVFLDWLVAGGLIGLGVYLALYVYCLILAKKIFWRDHKIEFAIIVGLLCAYGFQNLFIFDNLASYILFFGLLAYIHSLSVHQTTPSHTVSQKKQQEAVHPGLVIGISLALFLTMSYMWAIKPFLQSTTLIDAIISKKNISENFALFEKTFAMGGSGLGEAREQFLNITAQIVKAPNIDLETKQEFAREALKQSQLHQKDFPEDGKVLLTLASGLNQIGLPDDALAILYTLRNVSPQKQHILIQIGISYLVKGDLEGALAVLKENYYLSPEHLDGAMMYTAVLLEKNDFLTAQDILRAFALQGTIPKPYIISILSAKQRLDVVVDVLKEAYAKNKHKDIKQALEALNVKNIDK